MSRPVRAAIAAVLAVALTTSGLAFAQDAAPVDDPIAALLSSQVTDAPTPPAPEAPSTGYTPSYLLPNRSGLDRPVMLNETGLSPDGPPDASEINYETRVRGSLAAAQGLQGPLDGGWILSTADGGKLFAFQMVDPGLGRGELEGAWRDLKRGEAIGAVGLIDDVQRLDGELTVRFTPRGLDEPLLVKLSPTSDRGWVGQTTDKAGVPPAARGPDRPAPSAGYAVVGVSNGPTYAPRPYDSTVRKAPARKPVAKAKKKAPAKKKKR